MIPSEIKFVLSQLGGSANKRLGQHFLIDKKTLEAIVETADIQAQDRILEIGPGLGVLTRELIRKGGEVIAIERDRRFVEYLVETIHESPLRVVQGDAAQIDWHEIVGDRDWKFISNLPYSIASLALRKALYSPHPPKTMVVLIQREVAERGIAKDGKISLLSLMVALASSEARIIRRVPAGAFFPPPKVESAILQITPLSNEERLKKWGIEPEKVMEIAKVGFAHPRKKLVSNLKSLVGTQLVAPIRNIENARAEDLSPKEWTELAVSIVQNKK